jgi:hypothetical protein
LVETGEDRPDPEEELNVDDMGVEAGDGEWVPPRAEMTCAGAVGRGGGGLEALRLAARKSPTLLAFRKASCILGLLGGGDRTLDDRIDD